MKLNIPFKVKLFRGLSRNTALPMASREGVTMQRFENKMKIFGVNSLMSFAMRKLLACRVKVEFSDLSEEI